MSKDAKKIRDAEERAAQSHLDPPQGAGTSGDIGGEHGSCRNEIEALRAELEKNRREFDNFACAIAHELRTPLRHIEAFAQLIAKEIPEASTDAQAYLTSLVSAAAEMRESLEALLRVCRVSHAPIARRQVDLKEVALNIVAKLQRRTPNRVAQVTFRGDLEVAADPDLTYLLIHALLENAWKYSQPRPQLALEIGDLLCGSQRVFYVRDFGIGFPRERAGELFEPFRRLHSEAEFDGVGLGLTLAKRIVERHGGEIWAEGEVGQGACFYFTLGK